MAQIEPQRLEPAPFGGELPYQVLPSPLQHLSNATMVSAGVLVKLPVKKRPVSALSRGSDSAPLKFLWPREVRGRLGTCGSHGRWCGRRRRLGITGNRRGQGSGTENNQRKFPEDCQTHSTLPLRADRSSLRRRVRHGIWIAAPPNSKLRVAAYQVHTRPKSCKSRATKTRTASKTSGVATCTIHRTTKSVGRSASATGP